MGDFQKANDINDADHEPCNNPKCPFNGKVKKNSYEWFCSQCMLFKAIDTDKYLRPDSDRPS